MALNVGVLTPEIFLLSAALIMMVVDLIVPEKSKNKLFFSSTFAVLIVTLLLVVFSLSLKPLSAFHEFIKKDSLTVVAQILILFSAIFSSLSSFSYIERFKLSHIGEFYYTLLFAIFGGMLLVSSNELTTLFVSLEILSISLYILTALFKGDTRGKEAALKYFIMGSVGAAILVYGLAILYGLTGTTVYEGIAKFIESEGITSTLLLSVVLVASAFLFKTGAVPFHTWVGDVYHGAPTPVSAFMGAAAKTAVFIAFIKLFLPLFSTLAGEWRPAIIFIAVLTMFAGALLALNQDNLKRMLAFSAVSHTGVILAALATVPALATYTVLFYLFVYIFMTVAAFGLVSMLTSSNFKGEDVKEWAGLYKKSPFIALCAVVIFMSLAGIPPLAGFWAKFYVILALVREGMITAALVVVLSSLISLYFYLKPVVFIFMKDGGEAKPNHSAVDYAVVATASFFILMLGLTPNLVAQISLFSVASFIKGLL